MRILLVGLVAGVLLAGCRSLPSSRPPAPAAVAVIPAPAQVMFASGAFTISNATQLATGANADLEWITSYFHELILKSRGLDLKTAAAPHTAAIAFRLDPSVPVANVEGYVLEIDSYGARISARDRRGIFYGAISLWQLMTAGRPASGPVTLAALRIVDEPRFRWRGVMLDSVRHFQAPEEIERFVDGLAIHKLNVLHWHLTDDQAWRLEIKKYPRLTQVGAWRVPAGHAPAHDIDPATGKPRLYGGFYSQETVRHLVDYALKRGVTIVPEIEMPGHASAAIVAYPRLASTDRPPTSVPSDWGVYPNLYNVDESTLRFLEDVLDEVMALFPGEYIHVGGDEAVKTQWRASPTIQRRMRELGAPDENALQSFVVHRMEEYLSAHGRRLIGWDEILEGGIAPNATVMSWRGVEGAITAARAGHDAVLSPSPTLYLDHLQSNSGGEPPGRGGVIGVEDVYRFEPQPASLKPEEAQHILGLQADLWTEHVRTAARAEYMTFPRVAALAEVGWSPGARLNWTDFVDRLVPMQARYRALDLRAADGPFAVRIDAHLHAAHGMVGVELANAAERGDIHYTLDGSEPAAASPVFRAPTELPAAGELHAASFVGNTRTSAVVTQKLDRESVATRSSRELKLCGSALPLALEDDAPLTGPRAVFMIDILNPCWLYTGVDLSRGAKLAATVGQLPFNFQIGDDVKKIVLQPPATPAGELEIRLDHCRGEVIATLPLVQAATNDATTELPEATLPARPGKHDLCLSFTQSSVDPMWVLDWVRVLE